MKTAYPIILTPAENGYTVYVPNLQINTEGSSVADALSMAADAIAICGISKEDLGQEIPAPSTALPECAENEMATFVLVDFDAYRRATDKRIVRRNVSLPLWLDTAAKEARINVSAVLVSALKEELQITDR